MEYTEELINSLLDNKKIISTELDYTIMELKKSLISDWRLEKMVEQTITKTSNHKSNLKQNNSNNNYKEFISNGIQM